MNNLWSVALVLPLAYVALVAALYFSQNRLLFLPDLPSRRLTATPESVGLSYRSLKIRTEDGVLLHGWYLPAQNPRGTLLFCHGNAGNISHRLASLEIFHRLGLAVLIFDYRGYGQSEGRPSEQGTYRDAEAAWRYLTEQRAVPPTEIFLFGRSLGAAVATHLAARQPVGGLIIESAFTSVPDLAAELYPFLPARWLARFSYDTRDMLRAVSSPVLVIHSREDDIIPFHHGRHLYQAAHPPKQFLELRGDHNGGFLLSGAIYLEGLRRFLDDLTRYHSPAPPPTPTQSPAP